MGFFNAPTSTTDNSLPAVAGTEDITLFIIRPPNHDPQFHNIHAHTNLQQSRPAQNHELRRTRWGPPITRRGSPQAGP